MIQLAASGIRAAWEPSSGHLPLLEIGGAPVLWAAPWRGDTDVQSDAAIPYVDRRLGGTFVCAPFGRDDVDDGPPHGACANAPWHLHRAAPASLTAGRALARGHITATLALRDEHPVLYQTHVLELDAPTTFAHHPIVPLAGGGRLSGNPRASLTFAAEAPVLEQGARAEGWIHGLRDYPTGLAEDFATLVHAPGLAWTAVARAAEDDTIIMLKRAEQLPATNLWLSNGARSGMWRAARGLLGIEDAICAGAEGFAAALGESRVGAEGVPTALPPGRHAIVHAIVRVPGRHDIAGVTLAPDRATFDTGGAPVTIPFDGGHFA
ncbi:hypothetical protein ACK8OR_05190 [Jannaschia sp. KMU-145]|uniref:hypothetical protein n=1 Tax=Jannaschia halovivens TaxID=3388667 RepID=UPI00396B37F9